VDLTNYWSAEPDCVTRESAVLVHADKLELLLLCFDFC